MEIISNSNLLRKTREVILLIGNGTTAEVLGKVNVNVDIKNTQAINSLLVDGIKNNILIVGQIVDKGNVIVFTSIGCKIIKEDTRKTIAKGCRNADKLYVLKKNSGRNKIFISSSLDSE